MIIIEKKKLIGAVFFSFAFILDIISLRTQHEQLMH